MKKLIFSCLVLLASPLSAHAWWDGGHMVVAQIAYDRLSPETRREADRLAALGATAKNNTFVTAACWADDLKEDEGVYFFNTWHYADRPLYAGEYPRVKPEGDLLWALAENKRILKSAKASDYERARALRFLIHLVGDAHQPLHSVTRFAPETPKGDRGGNDFLLVPDGAALPEGQEFRKNLHSYWDSAGGWLAMRVARPLTADGVNQLRVWADAAKATVASMPAEAASERDFGRWVEEGASLAQADVYRTPFKTIPNSYYASRTKAVCQQQMAAGGRRLAVLVGECLTITK